MSITRFCDGASCLLPPGRVFGELLGLLHVCDGLRIAGWAQDLAHPDGAVCLDIVVDGAVVAIACAEIYRADSEAAGIGDGHHAFDLELLLAPEAAHMVEVRQSADGAVVGTLCRSRTQSPQPPESMRSRAAMRMIHGRRAGTSTGYRAGRYRLGAGHRRARGPGRRLRLGRCPPLPRAGLMGTIRGFTGGFCGPLFGTVMVESEMVVVLMP